MHFGGGGDPSLFVDSLVNIEGLQGLDGSGWVRMGGGGIG